MSEKVPVSFDEFIREYLIAVSSSEYTRDDARLTAPGFCFLCGGIYETLVIGSARANLTAILDPRGVAVRHILDSLIPLLIMERRGILKDGRELIDVGCGAGFPSLPIAAAAQNGFPQIKVTAADSTAKKTRHVEETASSLGIGGISVFTGRIEEAASPGGPLRERFDISTARAVAPLPVLLELTAPAVKKGGFVTAYKGRDDETEAAEQAAKTLGLRLCDKTEYTLPSGDRRLFVIYEKVAATPDRYPRQYAKMTSSPL